MKQILAVAQQKGGVGKTTTTITLGAALSEKGYRVLLIDLDPQGSLTAGVGVEPESLEKSIYDALRSTDCPMSEVIQATSFGFDLVPSNIDLAASEVELVSAIGRETILRKRLQPVCDSYDYIIFDCPPSLGLLTVNALAAATGVVIPVQTQYFALRGMELLLRTIDEVKDGINPELKIVGVLATMHDGRTLHAQEVLETLTKSYGNLMFEVPIPSTIKFPDSAIAGKPLNALVTKAPAMDAYREMAKEVEARG